jgi:hypothetical protein
VSIAFWSKFCGKNIYYNIFPILKLVNCLTPPYSMASNPMPLLKKGEKTRGCNTLKTGLNIVGDVGDVILIRK